jgi:hypothetical protein
MNILVQKPQEPIQWRSSSQILSTRLALGVLHQGAYDAELRRARRTLEGRHEETAPVILGGVALQRYGGHGVFVEATHAAEVALEMQHHGGLGGEHLAAVCEAGYASWAVCDEVLLH